MNHNIEKTGSHLRARNKVILFILVSLVVMIYILSFIRVRENSIIHALQNKNLKEKAEKIQKLNSANLYANQA
jgi:hypothetical protein